MDELIKLIKTLDENKSRDRKLMQCLMSLVKGHKNIYKGEKL